MGGFSILICDDETDLAGELGEFFTTSGWSTIVRTTAPDALEALHGGLAPTCLLTDLRIGEFDGAELVTAARRLPPHLQPSILAIMTGHVVDSTGAGDFGVDFLYVKPIDPDVVLNDLELLLSVRGDAPQEG
ncbi:response regulator [Aquabacter sp. CN5-332]|uniref:response regulator n=1 Tax=Aquabacter sp. CN5-332 TaxID=3156608 RepID=UPI0032B4D55E